MFIHEADHHPNTSLFNLDALFQKRTDVVSDHFLQSNKSKSATQVEANKRRQRLLRRTVKGGHEHIQLLGFPQSVF